MLNTDRLFYEDFNDGEVFIDFSRFKKDRAQLLLEKEVRVLLTNKFQNSDYLNQWSKLLNARMAKGNHPARKNNFFKMLRVVNPAEEDLL